MKWSRKRKMNKHRKRKPSSDCDSKDTDMREKAIVKAQLNRREAFTRWINTQGIR